MDKKQIALIVVFAGTFGTSLLLSIKAGQLLLASDRLHKQVKDACQVIERLDNEIVDSLFEDIVEHFED